MFLYLELLFLVVCHVVQKDREKAKHKDGKSPRIGNLCWVSYKEVGGKCVKDLKSKKLEWQAWCCTDLDPGETTPAEIVASPVQGDVQCVEVSSFPIEELEEIDVDEEGINNRTKFEAIKLNGSYSKVDNKDCPSHHASPAIGPLLNVDASQTRVKLYTSIELVRQRCSLGTLRHLRVCVTWHMG